MSTPWPPPAPVRPVRPGLPSGLRTAYFDPVRRFISSKPWWYWIAGLPVAVMIVAWIVAWALILN